jgi:hypothetical protein
MVLFDSYADAAAALGEGELVCGAYRVPDEGEDPDPAFPIGRPVYFTAPVTAGPELMRELGFQARFGKPMDDYQRARLADAIAERS